MEIKFRPLKESEIECRIGQVAKSGTGLSLLLYKTSRTDAILLDETVGPFGWESDYKSIDGKLFCGICISDFDDNGYSKHEAWKWDTGTESNMEAQKGEASDAFKRAGFKWGIGRELYTAPFIWVPADKCNLKNGKCYDTFSVKKIRTTKGRITGLVIANDKAANGYPAGNNVYVFADNELDAKLKAEEEKKEANDA